MKKTYIIGLICIAVAIGIFVNAAGDVSTYATFDDAQTRGKVKVTGTLDLEQDLIYNPDADPNSFSFHMKDNNGNTSKVIVQKPKPQDFELSEQVVVTGKMNGEIFVASEVLTKCPSKYKDEELILRADS